MRMEKRDNSRENLILFAMLHNTEVLAYVAPRLTQSPTNTLLARISPLTNGQLHVNPVMARSAHSRVLMQLCLTYYQSYGEAPGANLAALIRCWGEEQQDQTLLEMVELLWTELSQNREKSQGLNTQYILDLFNKHYRERTLRVLAEDIVANLDSGNAELAEEKVFSYLDRPSKVGDEDSSESFLLNDDQALLTAFEHTDNDVLIHYPDGLGQFFGTALQREKFVSFLAAEGTGKSFWLMDLAFRAICERRRVAFFEVGDMTKQQFILRLAQRLAGKPVSRSKCGDVQYPLAIDDHGLPQQGTRFYPEPVTADDVFQARNQLLDLHVKSHSPYFYFSCSPAGTLPVTGIEAKLRKLEKRHYWVPDAIIIDYADLLAPPKGYRMEVRDQIAENWKQLRALSMKTHTLVATATQCNREGYDAKYGLRMRHVSEEKRKISHVTFLAAITATDEDKSRGVHRLNCLKDRDQDFNPGRLCYAAGCLTLGQPAVVSVFPQMTPRQKKKDEPKGED